MPQVVYEPAVPEKSHLLSMVVGTHGAGVAVTGGPGVRGEDEDTLEHNH